MRASSHLQRQKEASPWPRRVLMSGDAVGGVWQYALELAAGLAGHGVEVLLAVMGDAPRPHQRAAAAGISGVRLVSMPYRLEWMADANADLDAAGRRLLGLEKSFAPDVVHLNGYAHADLAWRAPVVVVAHSCVRTWWRAVHGEDPPPAWDTYTDRVGRGLAAAQVVIAPTQAFLDMIEGAYGPVSAARVVTNGRIMPRRTSADGKEPVILCAARLWDEAKDVRTLDAAAAAFPLPVYVAGATVDPSGSGREAFAHVRPLGALSDAALRRWFDRAAVFVSPALYEPFGLAVLEAAQSRCALVLSDIPTLRELWDGAALFVPPRDTLALAGALAHLAEDQDRLSRLGAAAAWRAQHYSRERMVQGTLAAYTEAASPRRTDAVVRATVPLVARPLGAAT
jgi:glycogen(starch) synthase